MRNRHCCVAVPPPSTVLVRPHGRCQRRTARPTGSESQTPAVAAVRRGGAHSPGSEGTWGALAGGGVWVRGSQALPLSRTLTLLAYFICGYSLTCTAWAQKAQKKTMFLFRFQTVICSPCPLEKWIAGLFQRIF